MRTITLVHLFRAIFVFQNLTVAYKIKNVFVAPEKWIGLGKKSILTFSTFT